MPYFSLLAREEVSMHPMPMIPISQAVLLLLPPKTLLGFF